MHADPLTWCKWIAEIQSISQSGLAFTKNEFDIERYQKLIDISAQMAASSSQTSPELVNHYFHVDKGYATPKVDVRSFILKQDKLLLVRERVDQLWTLPGGFADVGESPAEAVIRETKEESGFDVSVVRLLAFWDKLKHDHPVEWPHIYKCFFYCDILSGKPNKSLEISDVDFFDIHNLPPLSTPRVTQKQIACLYDRIKNNLTDTLFD